MAPRTMKRKTATRAKTTRSLTAKRGMKKTGRTTAARKK